MHQASLVTLPPGEANRLGELSSTIENLETLGGKSSSIIESTGHIVPGDGVQFHEVTFYK
jgi:hypothetical protein